MSLKITFHPHTLGKNTIIQSPTGEVVEKTFDNIAAAVWYAQCTAQNDGYHVTRFTYRAHGEGTIVAEAKLTAPANRL